MQGERAEESTAGRVVLTALMAVLALCVLLWNLPAGRPRDEVRPYAGTVLLPIGLDQDWALFAPDPRSFSVDVYARLTRDDGRTTTWSPPEPGLLLAPYRTYRWQKYVERLRADDQSQLWEPAARWVARQGGSDVRRVELVRTFRETAPPGSGKGRPATREFVFYSLDVG